MNNHSGNQSQPEFVNNAFAIMASGQPLITKCAKISKDKFLMEIGNPGLLKSIGVSILNANQLPNNVGFAVYYSLGPSFDQFEFLGVLHGDYPTAIFDAPWVDIKGITACKTARIGFELKSKDFLKSLQDSSEKNEEQKRNVLAAIKTEFAMQVANNLYNFMSSYVKSVNDGSGEMLVAPAKCLDQWHERFKRKYLMDPKFMKSG